ncbi:hypothetical protein [Herbaspirillum sp. RV1423]|uniref:hypothetical protein n=1 Tax=Herbaspirillum sp. RV1423 TaxID=1443993 RepID=UPI0004BB5279|nr:hypothetical protein [Herbaspirillum sp. RV1423]
MSYSWHTPEIPLEEEPKGLSVWLFLFVFFLCGICGAVLRLATWPQGKPVDGAFWVGFGVIPMLIAISISAFMLFNLFVQEGLVLHWNFLCAVSRETWQDWARVHVVVLDSVVVTPEPDLAERLLGLEGSPPSNPGKVLSLPSPEDGMAGDRLAALLAQLLSPLAPAIRRVQQVTSLTICIEGGHQDDVQVVQRVWKTLNLPQAAKIVRYEADGPSLLCSDAGTSTDSRLVLAYQLLDPEQDVAAYSELGTGLILISPETASRLKLTQRTRLLRTIDTTSEDMSEALGILLRAKQATAQKLRHVWFSRLDKTARHAVKATAQESLPAATLHDIDEAIGKPGPANGWLSLALAAQMVRHGQGAQLVASVRDNNRMAWNIVTSTLESGQQVQYPDVHSEFVYAMYGISFMLAAFACGLSLDGKMDQEILSWMAVGTVVFTLLVVGAGFWMRRNIENQFLDKLTTY